VGSGMAAPLTARVVNLATLQARGGLWAASVEAWLQRPVFGWGAGSYPFLLQQTDYFQTSAWSPLHPDSAIFQLLPEVGIFGVAAGTCVLMGVLLTLARSRPVRWSAVWATAVIAIACLAANPTDFGFLIGLAILWLAVAAPLPTARRSVPVSSDPRRIPSVKYLAPLVALCVVELATFSASLHWQYARASVAAGDLQSASRDAEAAAMLDPGEAIYHRGYAEIAVARGTPETAISQLEVAGDLNPGDPTVFRALAVAESEAGDVRRAIAASETAVRLQASSVPNLLLYARLLTDGGDAAKARQVLAEAVRFSPGLLASPIWAKEFSRIATPRSTIGMAAEQWAEGAPITFEFAGAWLAVLADRPGLLGNLPPSNPDLKLYASALQKIGECEPAAAAHLLDEAASSKYYGGTYWSLRAILAAVGGSDTSDPATALRALGSTSLSGPPLPDVVSVLQDQSTFAHRDLWGYHRLPLGVDLPGFDVPLATSTTLVWFDQPVIAAQRSNPSLALSSCS
jgi:tetratricopeptide (TPR) repeat protein